MARSTWLRRCHSDKAKSREELVQSERKILSLPCLAVWKPLTKRPKYTPLELVDTGYRVRLPLFIAILGLRR
jgi:hypothetical protein